MTNQEYNTLDNSVEKWLKEKEDYELRKNKVLGLNPNFYLVIFSLLFLYIFFIKDANFTFGSKENNKVTSTTNNFTLYEKPNNNSNVILQNDSAIEVKILDETKFYYHVAIKTDKKDYKGYINKNNVTK